jgi:hypothetical protein
MTTIIPTSSAGVSSGKDGTSEIRKHTFGQSWVTGSNFVIGLSRAAVHVVVFRLVHSGN